MAMDVVYAFVEGVHIFVPIFAIIFLLAIVYLSRSAQNSEVDDDDVYEYLPTSESEDSHQAFKKKTR